MKFSERYGYTNIKGIQEESIDKELRIRLWNLIQNFFLKYIETPNFILRRSGNNFFNFYRNGIWGEYFKFPVDDLAPSSLINQLREIFEMLEWYKIYNLIEYIAEKFPTFPYKNRKTEFTSACNLILREENSAYRLIGNKITKITSDVEIAEIEKSLKQEDPFEPISIHIKDALQFLSDRETPNYRNSIKESISAVESICNILIRKHKASLGQAIKEVEKTIPLHKSLKDAFIKLYGYTSDEGGIRHALLEESKVEFEDAKFMLVACSAFINYLKEKASRANLI